MAASTAALGSAAGTFHGVVGDVFEFFLFFILIGHEVFDRNGDAINRDHGAQRRSGRVVQILAVSAAAGGHRHANRVRQALIVGIPVAKP
ncbi:MAG: hypothetical protein EA377_01980 [Phycisphaerales bacterium]|nr:MAG: hypothetical protein EA377_01980 [Phycisphaerales bacterium]